jgi:hypothetical protein
VDAGFAPQPIMEWDPLIVEFTVISGFRSTVIKAPLNSGQFSAVGRLIHSS